ncbi:MAG: single-stranded-DNA-specific exonuclease RecJ, partial [Bacillota bacterium]|nr:single-stranded-DNA-specific exonuclease RecJ [Bacillota bacterium]
TALLYSLLQRLGAEVTFYIPSRLDEGYGLHKSSIDYLYSNGVSTIITVDCGINSVEEVKYARSLGMDVIITDHHQPHEILPEADAVINPLRNDCLYPFKDLCGVGIAFKLGHALLLHVEQNSKVFNLPVSEEISGISIWEYLDLVALGTIADISPLVGENRTFVFHGLLKMENNLRPGLEAVCETAGLHKKKLTAKEIAFFIAPRLNAAGRLGDASRALFLLLEKEKERASEMALELHEENKRRQALGLKTFKEACAVVEKGREEAGDNLILLASDDWHHGVLGIVASRMVEKYNVPVILIAMENGIGKGSGRSTGDFDLTLALKKCQSLMLGFGGHRLAAGLSVKDDSLGILRERLNALAGDFYGEETRTEIHYADAELEPEEMTPELVRELARLEPFGFGNAEPSFRGGKWFLEKKREVGKEKQHLQLGLKKNNISFPGICFNGKDRLPPLTLFRGVDLFFSLAFDEWRGDGAIQLEVQHCYHCDEYEGKSFTLVDRRNCRKLPYLDQLVDMGEGILVFVNTIGRLRHLEKKFAGRENICFSHQGNMSSFQNQEALKHLVFFDLPMVEAKLKVFLSYLSQVSDTYYKLHILYGNEDYQENNKLLLATVPNCSSMEQVCFALQKLAIEGIVPARSIYSKLGKMLPFPTTKYLLEKSIEILRVSSYLQLDDKEISLQNEGNDYCSLFRDMSGLELFRKEREKWEQAILFQQILLQAAGEETLKLLTDFTIHHG